jgi:hypothetical protein
MFTAHEYRTKATEYGRLLELARSPSEISEYRDLHQSYSLLADNLDWLTRNAGNVVVSNRTSAPRIASKPPSSPSIELPRAAQVEEERILRCLGVAVVINWNTFPVKLQHAVFEDASSIQRERGAPLKGALARFLHDHKDDAPLQQQNGGEVALKAT